MKKNNKERVRSIRFVDDLGGDAKKTLKICYTGRLMKVPIDKMAAGIYRLIQAQLFSGTRLPIDSLAMEESGGCRVYF